MKVGKVFGVGLNDASYAVSRCERGMRVLCPYYRCWHNMLRRCYVDGTSEGSTYLNCIVCDDWLKFSNFKRWMELQDWEGKQLDKDLLSGRSLVYSPDTCIFLDQVINLFISNKSAVSKSGIRGVEKHGRWYRAVCTHNGVTQVVGKYETGYDAGLAYLNFKRDVAEELVKNQNSKVAEAVIGLIDREIKEYILGD